MRVIFSRARCVIISRVKQLTTSALNALAAAHDISPAMALGLGAGVYFEYYRRPQPPTRFITGLNRACETTLRQRLPIYHQTPHTALRDALRENALWFNLDRQPTTALLGIEMLAEELVYYDKLADWRECFHGIAREIVDTHALYRRTYCAFLQDIAREIDTAAVATELGEIADEWQAFAMYLKECAAPDSTPSFERAGRLVRRIAFREEHFWGKVLDL